MANLVAQMKEELIDRFRHLVALWIAGNLALAFATWGCLQLGLNFATTALVFLTIIVLLSLMDSLISSAVFSVIAVGSLSYFFAEPLFSFYVDSPQDIAALATFLFTSLAVTGLARRVRRLGEAHLEQTRLLDLTHDPIFVRGPNDVITYWNPGAEELYGWKRGEALGKVAHQLLQTVFPRRSNRSRKRWSAPGAGRASSCTRSATGHKSSSQVDGHSNEPTAGICSGRSRPTTTSRTANAPRMRCVEPKKPAWPRHSN